MGETIKHGHNNIQIKAGQSYNLTFDADTKQAIRDKDNRIKELAAQIIRMNRVIILLRIKHDDFEYASDGEGG